ncbi:hypothetical protein B0H14DRAFT_3705202 [Mycena olivaceomarginata]|nr:hypothetical protein B0H14DRAFT_3705202 [Mycena olivaceomarginata]
MAQTTGFTRKAEEAYAPRHSCHLGSIAGIVAARICGDHFERVIIVDPEIEDSEKPKTRILQYNAGHIFLSLFVQGARRLWPNFDSEMEAAGGRFGPADLGIHYSGVPVLAPYQDYPVDQFPDTLIVRRSIGQKVLHRLLTQHSTSSKLTRIAGTVRGVCASKDRASIDSVTARQLDGSHLSLDDLTLVVELAAKLPIPPAQWKTMMVYVYIANDEEQSSSFGLFHSNNIMQIMFADSIGRDLPRAAAEVIPFIAGFRGIKTPIPSWVTETIELLCEQGDPSLDAIKISTQSFVRYHTLPAGALPANFIALGDASLKLNPIHGSMMNGMALNSLLHAANSGLPADFSTRYFRNSADTMNSLWDGSKLHGASPDYGSPGCEPMEDETKDTGCLMRWFELKMISAAAKDDEVASALWHVRHKFAANRIFLAPTILWKVFWARSLF